MTEQQKEPDQPSTTETKLRSMGVALWHGVSAGILGMLVLTAVLALGIPLITGASAVDVADDAMSPSIPRGTLVVTQQVDSADVSVGDVIALTTDSDPDAIVIRRVVGGDSASLIVRGDADEADAFVIDRGQAAGRLWYGVPLLGWSATVVPGPWRIVVLVVLAVAVIGWTAWMLVPRLRRRRR